jgi:hypothetical protein
MNAHPVGVRTKGKAPTVACRGPHSLNNFEVTRNTTTGQGHPRRAPKPPTICSHDVASIASLIPWLLLGVGVHVGWVS